MSGHSGSKCISLHRDFQYIEGPYLQNEFRNKLQYLEGPYLQNAFRNDLQYNKVLTCKMRLHT